MPRKTTKPELDVTSVVMKDGPPHGDFGTTTTYSDGTTIHDPKEDTMTTKQTAKRTRKPAAAKQAKPAAEAQPKPEAPAAAKPSGLLDPAAVAAAAEQARRQVAEQHRERLTALLAEGKSVKQIAEVMGTSRVGVRKVMALLDLKPAGGSGSSGANAERDGQIAEMTAAGASPAEVAAKFNLSVGRSRRIMQKHGYARSTRAGAFRFIDREDAERALAAYQELTQFDGAKVQVVVKAVEAFLADEQGYQFATDAESASGPESTVSEPDGAPAAPAAE